MNTQQLNSNTDKPLTLYNNSQVNVSIDPVRIRKMEADLERMAPDERGNNPEGDQAALGMGQRFDHHRLAAEGVRAADHPRP